jgi:uncharacterized Zn-finger protein
MPEQRARADERSLITLVEGSPPAVRVESRPKSRPGGGYLKFKNDRGVLAISIGVKEFKCIGVSPPQDHPHIYINMGDGNTVLCPYCGTHFRFDPHLTRLDADSPDSLFADDDEA